MLYYTTQQLQGNNTSSDLFKIKGLNGSRACKISEVNIIGLPSASLTQQFLSNMSLPTAIHQVLDNTNSAAAHSRNLAKEFETFDEDGLPFEAPVLKISGVNPNEADAVEALGMTKFHGAKDEFVGRPSVAQFKGLVPYGDPTDKAYMPQGYVRKNGYHAWVLMWKILMQYAAFAMLMREEEHVVVVVKKDTVKVGGGEEKTVKFDHKGRELEIDVTECPGVDVMEDQVVYLEKPRVLFFGVPTDYTISGMSTWDLTNVHKFPTRNGFVFPYFHGLIVPDIDYLANTFLRLFHDAISGTPADLARMLGSLREGMRHLGISKAGQALTHAVFGVSLAKEMGAGIRFLREERQYSGFVLVVDDAQLIYGNALHIQGMNVPDDIEKLSEHRIAVSAILDIVEKLPLRHSGTTSEIVRQSVRCARHVADHIRARNLAPLDDGEGEEKVRLIKALERVKFNEEFWQPTPTNIADVINAIREGWSQQSAPFYFNGTLAFVTDPIAYALAVFGPICPSFLPVGGETVRIHPLGRENDPNMVLGTNGKRLLQYIPIYAVPYVRACNEWRHVGMSSEIKYVKGKGNSFADRKKDVGIAASSGEFQMLYEGIQSYVAWYKSVYAVQEDQRKRKAGPGVDERVSKKVTRAKADEFFMDL